MSVKPLRTNEKEGSQRGKGKIQKNSGRSTTTQKTQQTIQQLFNETQNIPCALKIFQVCLHKWTTDACTNKCQMMIASQLVEFEVLRRYGPNDGPGQPTRNVHETS